MATVLRVRERDGAVVAATKVARFDLGETDRFREELAEILRDPERRPLVLDLSSVTLLVSATLGALVELSQRCREQDRTWALVSLQPKVREVLRYSGLDHTLPIHDDEDAALASF